MKCNIQINASCFSPGIHNRMTAYCLLIVLHSLGASRHPGWSVNITLNKTLHWGNTAALVIAQRSRCCEMRLIRVLEKN